MTIWDRVLLVAILVWVIQASYESREAHVHTHELACAVGVQALCHYHNPTE